MSNVQDVFDFVLKLDRARIVEKGAHQREALLWILASLEYRNNANQRALEVPTTPGLTRHLKDMFRSLSGFANRAQAKALRGAAPAA